jgi:hypothetical protein
MSIMHVNYTVALNHIFFYLRTDEFASLDFSVIYKSLLLGTEIKN